MGGRKATVFVAHAFGRDRVEIIQHVDAAAPALLAQRPVDLRKCCLEFRQRLVVARLGKQRLAKFVARIGVARHMRQNTPPLPFARHVPACRSQRAAKVGRDSQVVRDLAQRALEQLDRLLGLAHGETQNAAVDQARQVCRIARQLDREAARGIFQPPRRHRLGGLVVIVRAHAPISRSKSASRARVASALRHKMSRRSTVRAA